ncbi:MAG: phosphonate ABC transporter, permease protein PhnE, partial [Pseudomonadota bacterium]
MVASLPEHLDRLDSELTLIQRRKTAYTFLGIAVAAAVAFVGVDMANSANATPFSEGITKIFDFPIDMMAMSYELGLGRWLARVGEFLPDLVLTLNMALLSTLLGFVFAMVMACFASRNIMPNATVVVVTRRLLDLFRSFPEIVIALVFLYLMGKSLLPAVIAITIHTTGALGKLFSEAIENIDTKPLDGLASTGAGWTSR